MCTGQTLSEAIELAKKGHKIHRLGVGGYLEMVKLQSGKQVIICVDDDDEDSAPGIWEPSQDDVLATDWIVE